MKKIEDYFPSHAKRAENFQKNLGDFLRNQTGIVDYDFYNYHEEDAKRSHNKVISAKSSKYQIAMLEKKLQQLDIASAEETVVGVAIYSELESLLIILNEDIDNMCQLYGGKPVANVTTIYETHESSLSRWMFSTLYFFRDK